MRPTFEGTFGGIYDFRFTPDFGSGRSIIVDAYAAARFNPGFVVTVGKFKPSVGLERLRAPNPTCASSNADCRRYLVPNRDLGVQLSGDFAGGAFAYQVGYFNGVTDGQSSDNLATPDVESDTGGRLRRARVLPAVHQLRQLQPARPRLRRRHDVAGCGWRRGQPVAAGLSLARASRACSAIAPTPRPASRLTTRRSPNGERLRLAPQLYYYRGSFGLLGEYTQVEAGCLAHRRRRHALATR